MMKQQARRTCARNSSGNLSVEEIVVLVEMSHNNKNEPARRNASTSTIRLTRVEQRQVIALIKILHHLHSVYRLAIEEKPIMYSEGSESGF